MKKKKKKNNLQIPKPNITQEDGIKFSFKFYDIINDQYCLSKWEPNKIRGAMRRLKEISEKKYNELMRDKTVLHFSPVDWSQTIKKMVFQKKRLIVLTLITLLYSASMVN